ncbi:hypothetical protein RBU61_03195 [Tissierella sp. MB52-C2]|uniref:hypothetical protein n=1 Tax=Tissierella sp. MB52-C2 TaxID=3070999 RepID=UPI00280A5818|nr:hypothetical protein [Tissierella sp. MB52-C2]WMM25688.1 hypothetical protein RBU61_03195 [Tissierella sp. MB52-C2]
MKKFKKVAVLTLTLILCLSSNLAFAKTSITENTKISSDNYYDIIYNGKTSGKIAEGVSKGYISDDNKEESYFRSSRAALVVGQSGFSRNYLTKKISAWGSTDTSIKYKVSVRGDMYKNYRYYNGAPSTEGYGYVESETPKISYESGDNFEFRSFHKGWNSSGGLDYEDTLVIDRDI